jgi:hypothetical protein
MKGTVMKQLIFALFMLFFLMTPLSVLAQEQDNLNSIYIQTSDGRIYLLNPDNDDIVLAYDFDLGLYPIK